MKRLTSIILTVAIMMTIAASSFAFVGGAPAKHGVDARTFGAVVASKAITDRFFFAFF